MLQPSFQCSVPPATTEGASSASSENPKARSCRFPTDSCNTIPPRASLTREIFSGLRRAYYPVGDGSAAILHSVAPNRCRVRWLSASSSK